MYCMYLCVCVSATLMVAANQVRVSAKADNMSVFRYSESPSGMWLTGSVSLITLDCQTVCYKGKGVDIV